jgi:hypothetical protein
MASETVIERRWPDDLVEVRFRPELSYDAAELAQRLLGGVRNMVELTGAVERFYEFAQWTGRVMVSRTRNWRESGVARA